jgi:demethylmenaquinone methyltransferase/2-methoxy-6-polyprenyl-1,4-benzoquinol methylase
MSNPDRLDLREYITSKDKKQLYVNQMFSKIAPCYDLVTALLSYGQDRRWKRKLVQLAEVRPQHIVLDLACGTGDITLMLGKHVKTGRVLGIDITPGMIEIACRKRDQLGMNGVGFELGDVTQLSFPQDHFDRITVGYGLRNVPDISMLLSEIHRMLKPGGLFLSLDFAKPVNPFYQRAYLRYLTVVGSTLGWMMHGDPDIYRYIPESLKLYPAQHGVKQLMDAVGFIETGFLTFGGGITAINHGRK